MKFKLKLLVLALAVFGLGAGYVFFDSKPAEAYNQGDLIISEFYLGTSGSHWIELVNTTNSDIDLSGWDLIALPLNATDTPGGPPSTSTLSGLVPAKGMFVIYTASLWLGELPNPSFLQIINGSDVISAVSYGFPYYTAPYVDQPIAGSGESAIQDNSGNWNVTTTISQGWFNITTSTLDCDSPPAPGPGVTPPSLSAIATCLPPGVVSNMTSSIADPTNASGLEFEKEGAGRIVFGSTLNLTDQNSMNLLQNLKTKLELDGGRVALDASTAELMRDAGAEIYFYGLNDLGYHNIDINSVIVRDDSGNIIPTSSVDYPEITSVNWSDTNTGTLYFNSEHFSGYETVPVLAEITPVPDPINTTTPNYTFSANVTGTYMFLGDCSSTPMGSTTNGNNTITIGPVTEGYHSNCAVKVIDGAGSSSTLQMSSFNVDVTQPQVTTTTPNPMCVGAGAVGSSTFNFTVFYGEPMDQTVTPTVAFVPPLSAVFPDGSRVYSWVNSTTFRMTSDVAMMDGSTWTNVTSTVSSTKDLAGNYSSDLVVPYSFFVSYVTSSPPVIDSVDGSTSSPYSSNNANPIIVVSGLTVDDVLKIYDGASEIDSVTATATTMVRSLTFTDGSHTITAKAVDPCGNVSDASATFVYTVDATPPSAPTINQVDGSASSPKYGSTSTPVVYLGSVTTTDTYYLYDTDGTTILSSGPITGAPMVFSTISLSPGSHTLTAKAVDTANNTSSASNAFIYVYDNTPPTVSSTLASPDPAIPGTVTITVVFDEAMDTGTSPTVQILGITGSPIAVAQSSYIGDTWIGIFTLSDNNEETIATTSVSGAKDSAGNTMVADADAGTFAVDSLGPVITFTDDTSASPVTSDTIIITVSGNSPSTTSYLYGYSSDATCDGTDTYATSFTSGGAFVIATSTHTNEWICAKAMDTAGNITYQASANPLNIDLTPPAAPTINSVNSTSTSPLYGNTSTLVLTLGSLDVSSTVHIYASSTLVHTFVPSGISETVTTTIPFVGEGVWDIYAFAFDSLSNTSSDSNVYVYNYDTTAPSVASVDTTKPDGAYPKDAIVGINVNFDETVIVSGTPRLYLNVGPGRYTDWLAFGMNYFSYTVVSGDATQDLDYASTTALVLNGGTIKDLAGNDAILTLPATGTFSSVHDIIIDTATPTVAFTDDVETGPVSSDTITITVNDTNPDTSSYAYAYSSDAVCDDSDNYSSSFTSGVSFTVSYNTNNGKYICARARDLANNTTYLVSANDLNVSTAPPSGGGGGGGDRTAPTNLSMQINGGATSTASTFVSLTIGALDATYMKISNLSTLADASWQPFTTSEGWTLESGLGTKKVWIQFRDDAYNVSAAIYDTIELVLPGQESPTTTIEQPKQQPGAVGPSCPVIKAGDMVKVVGKPAIYAVNQMMEAMYFPSGDEFKSWRPTYGGYLSVDQECFDSLKVPKSYPAAVNFRPGSYLLKRPSSDQLYVILPGNTLAKITSAVAEALYGKSAFADGVGSKVMTVDDVFWPHYINRSAEISLVKAHEGMLIKSGEKTYYIDAGNVKREVTSAGFIANGFQERFVRIVPASALDGMTAGDIIDTEIKDLTDKTQGAGGI